MKVGIVGLGNVFPKHLTSIERHSGLEFVAGCDIDETKKSEIEVNFYNDIDKMLSGEELDVVSICTPNYLHPKHIEKVMTGSSAYCICEKPLCVPRYQLEDIIELSRSFGDRIFPVSQNRFNPYISHLKDNIEDIGKVYTVYLNQIWNRNDEYFKSADWRGTKGMDGGGLLNQGYHFLDIIYYLFGEFEVDYAVLETRERDIEIEDSAVLGFTNGEMKGTYTFSLLSTGGNLGTILGFVAENLTVELGGYALNELKFWSSDSIERPQIEDNEHNVYDGYKGSLFKHPDLYEDVFNHITKGERLTCSIEEAIEVHRIIKRIYDRY